MELAPAPNSLSDFGDDVITRNQDIIELVAGCLAYQKRKHQIKLAIRQALGEGLQKQDGTPLWKPGQLDRIVCPKTVEILITYARRLMVARATMSMGMVKMECAEFLRGMLADDDASNRDKIEAIKALIELTGVSAHDQREKKKLNHEISKTAQANPNAKMSPAQTDKLTNAIKLMEQECL
jgi:hypothetical protein